VFKCLRLVYLICMSSSILIFCMSLLDTFIYYWFNDVFNSSIPGITQAVQCLEYGMDERRTVVQFPAGERFYLIHISKPAPRHIQAYA
jgi:hypothetical protein